MENFDNIPSKGLKVFGAGIALGLMVGTVLQRLTRESSGVWDEDKFERQKIRHFNKLESHGRDRYRTEIILNKTVH